MYNEAINSVSTIGGETNELPVTVSYTGGGFVLG